MTAEATLGVRSWKVGDYTCELTVQRPRAGTLVHAVCEWSPTEPSRLSTEEWREYRIGRNQAISELAVEFGINVAVLEL